MLLFLNKLLNMFMGEENATNPFQRFVEWLNSIFSFDERFQSAIDWFLSFPTLVKIPVLVLFLLIMYLGVFSLVKKIIYGIPKKIFLIVLFGVIVYFVLTYFMAK